MTEQRKTPDANKAAAAPSAGTDGDKTQPDSAVRTNVPAQPEGEVNGPEGPEPTRYGDWEVGGRCSDF